MRPFSLLLAVLLLLSLTASASDSLVNSALTPVPTTIVPKEDICTVPLTFICASDPGHNLAGPAPKPVATPQQPEAGLWESFVSAVASWVNSGLFGSETSATDPSKAAANERKSAFYDGADTGSECYLSTDKAYPDPETMINPQQDSSYFHIFCGRTANFHAKAEELVTRKLRMFDSPAVLGPIETATGAGFFPVLPETEEATSGKAKQNKLRSTALIIVPGGSYAGLSLFESVVMPLQVLYKANGDVDTETTYDPEDFLPIVLQYRLTPPTPDAPMEDISKVVRMLERYRQKRSVSAMQYCADPALDDDSNAAEGPEVPKHDVNGDKAAFGGDDAHLGQSGDERTAGTESQKRLSPAMLGLTDDFKIVIAGFSAGGHAVATYLAMASTIPISAAILVYPVIAMDSPSIAHKQSTVNLLRVEPDIKPPQAPHTAKGPHQLADAVAGAPPAPIANPLAVLPDRKLFAAAGIDMDDNAAGDQDTNEAAGEQINATTSDAAPQVPTKSEDQVQYEVELDRYNKQSALLHRYSPNHYPANFPQCVYMAHTKNDPSVNYKHSELMYYSLVRHRKLARRRVGVAVEGRAQNSTKVVAAAPQPGMQASGAANEVTKASGSSVPGQMFSSNGLGLRLYPEGPHGRWWVSKDYPHLRDWWADALSFLASNDC